MTLYTNFAFQTKDCNIFRILFNLIFINLSLLLINYFTLLIYYLINYFEFFETNDSAVALKPKSATHYPSLLCACHRNVRVEGLPYPVNQSCINNVYGSHTADKFEILFSVQLSFAWSVQYGSASAVGSRQISVQILNCIPR